MPRRLRLALLLASVFHAALILAARYRLSYDTYTHMLFADHYLEDWWSLWDPRWYAGFEVTSYPPLVHQVIALVGGLVGVDAAYALVLWLVLAAYPLAVFAFSRVFTGPAAAGFAALGAALLPSIHLSAHTFGQLPSMTATLFALFGAASLARYLRTGTPLTGVLSVLLCSLVLASHHATLLFLPFALTAVVLHMFLSRLSATRELQMANYTWHIAPCTSPFALRTSPPSLRNSHFALRTSPPSLRPSHFALRHLPSATRTSQFLIRNSYSTLRTSHLALRTSQFALLTLLAGLLIVWPFWRWGLDQSLQVPIDHQSRHSYFTDPQAALVYFLPVYGPLVFLIPFALRRAFERRFFGLLGAFTILFLIGLGGTTPLPRWLFGPAWEWLTYDRFAYWASLLLLPFFGITLVWLRRRLGAVRRRDATRAVFASLAAVALLADLYPVVLPTQPRPVEMRPILDFLSGDDRSHWRYLTFGFGDQFAYLNRLATTATTIDGSYHTARSLPELRTSGIAQIDTAFWLPGGLSALEPVLAKAGRHGVRWGFVNHRAYIPVLRRNGWFKLVTLPNGVQVWENPTAVLPPPPRPPPPDPLASFSWGVLPLLALACAASLAALQLRPRPAREALLVLNAIAVGLLPVALLFWYFRPLTALDHPRIYFTYSNALFFLSDACMLVAVLSWAVARRFGPDPPLQTLPAGGSRSLLRRFASLGPWLFALWLLALLSVLWSSNRLVSLYTSLHIGLVFALFLALRDRPETLRFAAIGFCAALGLQALVGFWQFALQSTRFLDPLALEWPGLLDASTRGASVVQLAGGERWLRVYGTLPHPNILGGFLIVLLSGPAIFYLAPGRPRRWAALLFAAGLALLVLTFSRGAWLGFAAAALVVCAKFRWLDRRRLPGLGLAGGLSLAAAALPLRALVITRITGMSVPTESFSIEARSWLAAQSLEVIRQHPLLGAGAGAFIFDLAGRAPPGYLVEPVHSLPLLLAADLGLGGGIVLAGLSFALLRGALRARSSQAVLLSAAVLGLGLASLFDHSLWTLAPGRTLLGLVLGLWAGQVGRREG